MRRQNAFTLIELLVVIAVIAVLMAILMPSLQLARRKAMASFCMGNAKTIAYAWFFYQSDADGRICSANPGSEYGWVRNPETAAGQNLGNRDVVEDEDEWRGIRKGKLFPFIKDEKVFHCPADKRISVMGTNVFRTYSIPSCLYAFTAPGNAMYRKQIIKFDQIKRPAAKYMLVEEADMREYNSGPWSFGSKEHGHNPEKWWDPLAIWHGRSSIIGFCDGHAEVHIWRDKFTRERVDKIIRENTTNYGTQAPPPDQIIDMRYMVQGWAYYD